MTTSDWRSRIRVVRKKAVFDGYFQVQQYDLQHALHAGGTSATLAREVFERGHVTALLPIDPVRAEVVLIEQFRPGAFAAGWDPWLIECVAGVIEPGELPEEVARRECVEETGLRVGHMELLNRYLTSPGACSETVHLYAGQVDATDAGGIHGLAEEGEDIRVMAMPITQALELLHTDRIVNSKTIIALQWLQMNQQRVLSEWKGD